MSELRKASTDRPYFITLTVVGWIDIFTRDVYCRQIIESLDYCRKNKGLKIYAYCIMSSHIHLIISHDESKLPSVLRDFKSFTAKRILELVNDVQESRREWLLYLFRYFANNKKQNSEHVFWQKTSYSIELITPLVFDQKLDYIHHNPVKAMVVSEATSYVYSSANPDSPLIVDES
ncbi:transposase [Mucilaginibacter sp. RS28]|uniref:Transposase n=1 Tax=Mucilaginibacter straminoryzae TaxID=2932774 RepID=A0A9X1X697_9SPHI|nr:transposase [Mucilaginibacter straminoryzae]MCJ8211703.1 transposase [Mucilaginibacter straminoryzae]